jgi:putative cell wall-binding protein
VNRIAGNDRFGTAVAIADAIGDPGTVFEVNGDTFADALAAGPAAAASHGAVLLTDGANMPSATGDYLANHAQKSWAIGGPAAVADPSASPIVGADRYETASMVAFQFIPSPNMIGVATGQAFPDALAAGSAIAHAGGALLLVNPNSVPDPTAAYINAHTTVPMLLYGGVNAAGLAGLLAAGLGCLEAGHSHDRFV